MDVSQKVETFKAQHPDAFQAIHDAGYQAGKAKGVEEGAAAERTRLEAAAGAETFSAEGYIKTFGDIGARWFYEKKSFASATAEYVAKLQADHKAAMDALKAENETMKTKLDAMPRGNEAASFSSAETKAEQQGTQVTAGKKFTNLPPHLAAVANAIRLPSAPPGQN